MRVADVIPAAFQKERAAGTASCPLCLLAAILALLLLGCARKSAPGPGLLARLERTSCLGVCPVYTVEIETDGTVRYEGREHVVTVGAAVGKLDEPGLQALREAFRRARFRELPRRCCDCPGVTDLPSVTTTLMDGESPKTIHDYRGCSKTPDSLRAMEDEIDRIVGIDKWIGTLDQRRGLWRSRSEGQEQKQQQ